MIKTRRRKSFLKYLVGIFKWYIFVDNNVVNKKLLEDEKLIYMVGVINRFKTQLQALIIYLDNSTTEMFPSMTQNSLEVS